jgi:hypothetical protein
MKALEEASHYPDPVRVANLGYAQIPDFPGIRELGVVVGAYTYLGPQRQKILRASEKFQAGAGGISLCSVIVVPNETGMEALFAHVSPDDNPSYYAVEEYIAENHVTQATVMTHSGLVWEQYDILHMLADADVALQRIPVNAGDRSFEAFFDLSKGELSAVGFNLAGETAGELALQQVVYQPFTALAT